MKKLIIISLLLITACGQYSANQRASKFSTRSITLLQKPGTKEYKHCGVNPRDQSSMFKDYDHCVSEYEQKGYKVVANKKQGE
jgi:hypothetical protein